MDNNINSAAKYIENLSLGIAEPYVLYGDFLYDFYRADALTKQEMLRNEPLEYDNVEQLEYATIAARVHKLASDYNLPVPRWTFNEKYYSKKPYFPVKNPNLKLLYMYESPTEFKHRNLFVSANTLSRA